MRTQQLSTISFLLLIADSSATLLFMDKQITKFPKVPQDLSSIIKPEELVDIVETTPLTLQDRRTFNLLIGNAWNTILESSQHTISRHELTKHVNSKNQDIAASLRHLMAAIVQIKIRNNRNGEPATRQIALLGSNEIDNGEVIYSFPPELVKVIRDTQIFARLHTKVMFQLTSKYSLALYEFLQKRMNLKYINSETLSIAEVRGMLGVEAKKLTNFGHLNKYALQVATNEVTFLTEYEITHEPVKTGRQVTHVKFSWRQKSEVGAQIAAVEELERSKVGRNARMQRNVEKVATDPPSLPLPEPQHTSHRAISPSQSALEAAKKLAIAAGTGWDIYYIKEQFLEIIEKKGVPDNIDGAFIGLVKKKIKTNLR